MSKITFQNPILKPLGAALLSAALLGAGVPALRNALEPGPGVLSRIQLAAQSAQTAPSQASVPSAHNLRREAETQNWPASKSMGEVHITAMQYLLRAWGHTSVAASGIYDAPTAKALLEFERARNITGEPDGVFDKGEVPINDRAWGALIVPLSTGARNDGVRALQVLVRWRGYDVPVDGIFTPALKLTVMKVQAHPGLRPAVSLYGSMPSHGYDDMGPGYRSAVRSDGILDAATWAELLADAWIASSYPAEAMQHLLGARGLKIAVGAGAEATSEVLKQAQKASGLVESGVLNLPTLEALAPAIGPGSRGEGVRALQVLVRALATGSWHGTKHAPSVSGTFDARTGRALRDVLDTPSGGRLRFEEWFLLFNGIEQAEAESNSIQSVGS